MADATVADPQRVAEEERKWFREHPEPRIDDEKEDELTLWNFPVGKADLAPVHDDAVRKFGGPGLFASTPEHPQVEFDVRGHASVTGVEEGNQDLGLQRAEKVKALLKWMGLTKVNSYSAGSSEPVDPGTSGFALARNRRVTVMRYSSTYPVVESSPPPQTPAAPVPIGSTVQVIVKINLALRPLQAPKVVIAPFIIGDLKVAVRGGDPLRAGVTTMSDRKPALTEEFERILVEQVLDPRLGVSGGTGKDPVSIKVGIAAEEWFLTPKVAYDTGVISFNFKAVAASLLPIVPFNGVEVIMEFSGSIRFDIAPLESTAAKYPLSATDPGPTVTGPAVAITPTDTDPLLIAETITDATKKVPPAAQEEVKTVVKRIVLNLATRDGAASRVAWEVLGVVEGRPDREKRKQAWADLVSREASNAWIDGSDQVEGFLIDLDKEKKGARQERKDSWKAKYSAGGQTFEFIRDSAFKSLKGYDEDQGDLPQLIKGL